MVIEQRLGGRIAQHAVAAPADTVRIRLILLLIPRPIHRRAVPVALAAPLAVAAVDRVGLLQVLQWYTRQNKCER